MYLGIDLGTSSVKLVLTDNDGLVLGVVSRNYSVNYVCQTSEQNPLDWFEGFNDCIKELSRTNDLKKVRALSFSGQMHGLVLVDKNGDIIRPAILWNDNRSVKENHYLNEVITKEKLIEYTENISFPGFTASKLLWVKNNEPDNFKKIYKVLLPKDYLAYKITGVYATDTTDASGTLYYDVKNKQWSKKMLDILGIKEEILPKVYEPETVIGYPLDDKYLSKNTKVSIGGADNAIGAVGTNTVLEDEVNLSLGTSGVVLSVSNNLPKDKVPGIHRFTHVGGRYYQMGVVLSATASLKWFQETILEDNYKKMDLIIDGPKNNIIFHPYLMGERGTINDVDAKGLFYGFDLSTKRDDLTKAVIEGISFSIKDCLLAMKLDKVKRFRIIGGGTKSESWIRLLATILNAPIETIKLNEGGAFGAAIVAMIADGKYKNYEDTSNLVTTDKIYYPIIEDVKYYIDKYNEYKLLYHKIK
ncbi:Xylulokinase [Alteracholeplasma palmae J233]|uniref:Xylulose kinase n=1 Tax=Alteracholeplasma palmae (strain ATCC 49389 / J233) TaxID=1318466 RepID=U4KKG6_ALTPJ|nr:xylulokinase [Alteracholeplasma palmae]CCV64224.1 Xylulokinase [Alteracholeplasma palmae J233]